MEGDEDEEDIDDIEHEFNIEVEQNKHKHLEEAMLHGKMSYGRGPDDDDNTQLPPVIAGVRSQPVSTTFSSTFNRTPFLTGSHVFSFKSLLSGSSLSIFKHAFVQLKGEFPISSYGNGEQMMPSSLHKRIHPDPNSEPGNYKYTALYSMLTITENFHDLSQ